MGDYKHSFIKWKVIVVFMDYCVVAIQIDIVSNTPHCGVVHYILNCYYNSASLIYSLLWLITMWRLYQFVLQLCNSPWTPQWRLLEIISICIASTVTLINKLKFSRVLSSAHTWSNVQQHAKQCTRTRVSMYEHMHSIVQPHASLQ